MLDSNQSEQKEYSYDPLRNCHRLALFPESDPDWQVSIEISTDEDPSLWITEDGCGTRKTVYMCMSDLQLLLDRAGWRVERKPSTLPRQI